MVRRCQYRRSKKLARSMIIATGLVAGCDPVLVTGDCVLQGVHLVMSAHLSSACCTAHQPNCTQYVIWPSTALQAFDSACSLVTCAAATFVLSEMRAQLVLWASESVRYM